MARQRIEPAQAENVVIAYLASQMPGADIVGRRTGNPRHRQIQVRKTGGRPADPATDTAQITITAWGLSPQDEDETERFANLALSWLRIADLTGVMAGTYCRNLRVLSTPYPDPDPVTGCARYSCTLTLDLRGTIHAA